MKNFMKITALFVLLVTIGFTAGQQLHASKTVKNYSSVTADNIKSGDIIFQSSDYGQSKAVKLATKSVYTHCGLIFVDNGRAFVLEAVQPVVVTPLNEWITNGQNGHYVIKRLADADKVLTPAVIANMKTIGDKFKGKNYDLTFEWSDTKMYCSELVWKIYQRATGLEVGKLQKLRELDLTSDVVKKIMKERYGANIPLDETVISPGAIFDSKLLVTVKSEKSI